MTKTLDELIKARIAQGRCAIPALQALADEHGCALLAHAAGALGGALCQLPPAIATHATVPRFDDVVRIEPLAPEAKRTAVELDDRKPQQAGCWLLGRCTPAGPPCEPARP